MQSMRAVVEEAKVQKISDVFPRKPPGLRFNETDVLIVIAKANDGKQIGATFYFSLKPDGTFEEEILGKDAAKARRHNLASFLRYYRLTDDINRYKLKERISELKGQEVELVLVQGKLTIYFPRGDNA
jgi:hypothetical protein